MFGLDKVGILLIDVLPCDACLLEFAAFIWFRDACRQGIQMGQGKSTRLHYFPFNSGRFWEVRHRYIDMVKVCFLGNLYQQTSWLSNWLWKHCYSPAWHLCISVLSVLWVSVNSFFQLHVGQGTNPIILMLAKWGQTSNHSPAHTRTGDGWEKNPSAGDKNDSCGFQAQEVALHLLHTEKLDCFHTVN